MPKNNRFWVRIAKVGLREKVKPKRQEQTQEVIFFFNLCSGNYTIKCKKSDYYDAKESVTIYNDYSSEGLLIPISPK
jgi:hypothetical protein